jgi:acyl-CoA thioesterase-2
MRETLAKHPGARYLLSHRMMWVDIRPIGFEALMAPTTDAHLRYWLRFQTPLPDEPLLHCSALAFISDLWLAGIGVAPHRGLGEAQQYYFAALSHSIWFHRPFRADDWLLFDATSPAAGNGQGLSEAKVFDRAGTQVATVVQSALITEMQPGHSGDAA